MPTTVVFEFPWGFYHATPWGKHVNEGAVEWPPSPWRILRALYSAWKNRLPDLQASEVESVLQQLAEPPEYVVPEELSQFHTRHYMPDIKNRPTEKGRGTDKIIDAFGVLTRGAMVAVCWPVSLEEEHREVLSLLVTALPYLGRAESICQARLAGLEETFEGRLVRPLGSEDLAVSESAVRVLVPQLPLDIAHLTSSPRSIRQRRLTSPPGSRWQTYLLGGAPEPASTEVRMALSIGDRPTAVR